MTHWHEYEQQRSINNVAPWPLIWILSPFWSRNSPVDRALVWKCLGLAEISRRPRDVFVHISSHRQSKYIEWPWGHRSPAGRSGPLEHHVPWSFLRARDRDPCFSYHVVSLRWLLKQCLVSCSVFGLFRLSELITWHICFANTPSYSITWSGSLYFLMKRLEIYGTIEVNRP